MQIAVNFLDPVMGRQNIADRLLLPISSGQCAG